MSKRIIQKDMKKRTKAEFVHVQNDAIDLSEEEVSLLKGKFGTNLILLSRVTASFLQLSPDSTKLIVNGNESTVNNVKHFLRIMLERRNNESSTIDTHPIHDDLQSALNIPSDCAAFISGYKNSNLRNLEEEFGTLLFIQPQSSSVEVASASSSQASASTETRRLCVLGPNKNRVGVLLRIMSCMSQMRNNSFLNGQSSVTKAIAKLTVIFPSLQSQVLSFTPKVMGFFIGSDGDMVRKISKASNCAIEAFNEYIACIGSKDSLDRAISYIEILQMQQSKPSEVVKIDTSRSDLTVLKASSHYSSWVIGEKGLNLREIERQTETFIFADKKKGDKESYFNINIFGHDVSLRIKAKYIIEQMILEKQQLKKEIKIKKQEGQYPALAVATKESTQQKNEQVETKAIKKSSYKDALMKS